MQRPSNCAVTTPFGYVKGYPLNGGYHMGVDFSPSPDNTIYAPEDGNYRLVPDNGSLGNAIHMYVGANHHAFGHTSKYLISDNQFVKRGTPIAIMGATGAADGVHLHWALAVNGSLVDPLSKVNEQFIGGTMNKEQAAELALYIRLLAFESVNEANSHSADDVAHIMADPTYAAAIAKAVYKGEWQAPANKATHYDELANQLETLKKQLASEQSKPPVIQQVPAAVDEKQVVQNVFVRFWNSLFKKG